MRILFVCTGNTCRSPMAEALLRDKLKGVAGVEIKSAGVAAFDGEKASENTLLALEQRGIQLQHSAQRLTGDLMKWADLVLTMTRGHKQVICDLYPDRVDKVFTLKQYVGWRGDEDVADPYGGSLEMYTICADELNQLLEELREILTTSPSRE
ncbi:low molecular weight protein arginine phosphatase [Brevibacillus humidisoli]|uniref:low molecular weight protein arginine phosphatase n=1 Tax=Brevibacillus humidisoli TaxID=2895522 RepID=UPI001E5CB8B4|nr:low molecular weight protein arginine phosphatase [Brevibacillus humidisoli]